MPEDDVPECLRAGAERIRGGVAGWPEDSLTDPDPGTGERWDRNQLLGHVVEMLAYWVGEARRVIDAGGDGASFGRVKSDPARIAAIERERARGTGSLLGAMDAEIEAAAGFAGSLDERALALTGTHPTRGEMTVRQMLEVFLVDHLEEHAEQLAR